MPPAHTLTLYSCKYNTGMPTPGLVPVHYNKASRHLFVGEGSCHQFLKNAPSVKDNKTRYACTVFSVTYRRPYCGQLRKKEKKGCSLPTSTTITQSSQVFLFL